MEDHSLCHEVTKFQKKYFKKYRRGINLSSLFSFYIFFYILMNEMRITGINSGKVKRSHPVKK